MGHFFPENSNNNNNKSTCPRSQHCISNFGDNAGSNHISSYIPDHRHTLNSHPSCYFQHQRDKIKCAHPPSKIKLDLSLPRGKSASKNHNQRHLGVEIMQIGVLIGNNLENTSPVEQYPALTGTPLWGVPYWGWAILPRGSPYPDNAR